MPASTRADDADQFPDRASAVEVAPAKINLALHVTGKRRDRYHLIDSLVVFAAVGDVLRAEPAEAGLNIRLSGPFAEELSRAGPAAENLALRAANALATTKRGPRPPITLHLEKRLPIASGVGGGSADAAAALRLLDRHWQLDTPPARLAKVAATLGADVPMCLTSRPQRATGIGDVTKPVRDFPALPVVLVNPGIQVPTKTVFARLRSVDDPPLGDIPRFRSVFELAIWLRQTKNALEQPAFVESKLIPQALRTLAADQDCLFARMSGSGATCFGIFATASAAQRSAIRLRIAKPEWWVTATMTGAS